MATIAATVEAIAAFALTVGGGTPILRNSYGIDDKLTEIDVNQLPLAVTMPVVNEPGRTVARSAMGGSIQTTFTVTQWVMFKSNERELHLVLPSIVAYMDAFNTAVGTTPFITVSSSPSAHNLPRPTFQIKELPYGNLSYWGIEYVYSLELNL